MLFYYFFFTIALLLQVVANYFGNTKLYEPYPGRKIRWAGPYDEAPPDTPKCGFDNSKCPPESKYTEAAQRTLEKL